jgi:hypothetical protein
VLAREAFFREIPRHFLHEEWIALRLMMDRLRQASSSVCEPAETQTRLGSPVARPSRTGSYGPTRRNAS